MLCRTQPDPRALVRHHDNGTQVLQVGLPWPEAFNSSQNVYSGICPQTLAPRPAYGEIESQRSTPPSPLQETWQLGWVSNPQIGSQLYSTGDHAHSEGRPGHKQSLGPSAWAHCPTSLLWSWTRRTQSVLAIPLGPIPNPCCVYPGARTQYSLRNPCLGRTPRRKTAFFPYTRKTPNSWEPGRILETKNFPWTLGGSRLPFTSTLDTPSRQRSLCYLHPSA